MSQLNEKQLKTIEVFGVVLKEFATFEHFELLCQHGIKLSDRLDELLLAGSPAVEAAKDALKVHLLTSALLAAKDAAADDLGDRLAKLITGRSMVEKVGSQDVH